MSSKFQHPFTHHDVKVVDQKTVYDGHFKMMRYQLSHRLFQGGWSEPFYRELFARGDAAAVLPFDPVLNKIVLIEQFRIGALHAVHSPWLFELVAGVIEKNETPENVVTREAKEEAGLTLLELMPATTFLSTPGACSEYVTLFCGKIDAQHAGGFHGLPQEHENIAVRVFDLPQVYDALDAGKISNSFTLIALQWLKLNEQKVRAQFTS